VEIDADSENHSPHYLRKRSHFGNGYHKTPSPEEKGKYYGDQEGCRLDLKPSPDQS
jgi:hypothetical protein